MPNTFQSFSTLEITNITVMMLWNFFTTLLRCMEKKRSLLIQSIWDLSFWSDLILTKPYTKQKLFSIWEKQILFPWQVWLKLSEMVQRQENSWFPHPIIRWSVVQITKIAKMTQKFWKIIGIWCSKTTLNSTLGLIIILMKESFLIVRTKLFLWLDRLTTSVLTIIAFFQSLRESLEIKKKSLKVILMLRITQQPSVMERQELDCLQLTQLRLSINIFQAITFWLWRMNLKSFTKLRKFNYFKSERIFWMMSGV